MLLRIKLTLKIIKKNTFDMFKLGIKINLKIVKHVLNYTFSMSYF